MNHQKENRKKTPAWIITGLLWGLIMFLIMEIAMPFADGSQLVFENTITKLLFWVIGGLVYGYTVQLVNRGSAKK